MRAVGPLSAMCRESDHLVLSFPEAIDGKVHYSWDWLASCHGLFLQRPWNPIHIDGMLTAKAMNIPIWVDWDDDLTSFTKAHPRYEYFNSIDIVGMLNEIMKLADFITVSTPELFRQRTKKFLGNELEIKLVKERIMVVPNASAWAQTIASPKRIISWRGSVHHCDDLDLVGHALHRVAGDHPDWRWVFMGDVRKEFIERFLPQKSEVVMPSEIHRYMHRFSSLRSFINIVPLCDNTFNRCKSNIAWLEATAAGALTLAPGWEEWQRPGILNYCDASDFEIVLRNALSLYESGTFHERALFESRKFVARKLTLDLVNGSRWKIIKSMARGSLSYRN